MAKKGEIINRINEENCIKENLGGYKIKIIIYVGANDIVVEFQDEYKAKVHTTYQHFKDGNVKNPYHPTIYEVGCFGEGKYKSSINHKNTREYETWKDMIGRCYNPYKLNKFPTYIDCYVEKDFLNFQNFASWYEKNYYEVPNEKMQLDKDILVKGNKIYSKETIIFVPERINYLFTKSNAVRGEYPIGVTYNKEKNMLEVSCSILDKDGKKKNKYLGQFPLNRPFQAFYTYKIFKENYIKQVADEYRDLIPKELYDALYRYEVEIND